MTAEFDKGVLSITVPKPEQRKPRRVEISAGGSKGGQRTVEGAATARAGEGEGESAGS